MDANERLHIEWIGMAQPQGLVVTAAALKAAEANITWPITELQETLRELCGPQKAIPNFYAFLCDILGWPEDLILQGERIPETLRIPIEGFEALFPAYALKSADDGDSSIVFLVGLASQYGPPGADLDAANDDKRWSATPHQRFERLLRATMVHVGLLSNGKDVRLVYAPKGESSGHITFRLADILSVDGRPLLAAMHMLLNQRRLLTLEPERRLLGLLKASREYQNTVSNALREQVLGALRELLMGFQQADRLSQGALFRDYRGGYFNEVYKGLVTVLMRSVFVLFAEEQNLLPLENGFYAENYSLTRLFAQLVEDHDLNGDTLDHSYGAWARMLALFRALHDGMRTADGFCLPARRGDFFDPDKFPFLEGRPRGDRRQVHKERKPLELPKLSDGVVLRLLQQLMVLNGERLQYKGLDVEQIGSVYEGLMGFEIEIAEGDSLCLMPEHVVINLEKLMKLGGADRLKQIKAEANLDLKDKAAQEVKGAKSVKELSAALSRRISPRQPGLMGVGTMYLQPGEERRKTGSHYTPKSLTAPIVETTLKPIMDRLGTDASPEQILDIRVCDPAMGSGAFLVESCRQLAQQLVQAWRRTGRMPELPADEELELHARRLVAQRCIYGVDKNPLAVDLARLSLWLVTFARAHPFTFVDHALRCGDSLVGVGREQISSFSLDIKRGTQLDLVRGFVSKSVEEAERLRREIHAEGDPPDDAHLKDLWDRTNDALTRVRWLGDLLICGFFTEDSEKARKGKWGELGDKVAGWLRVGQYESEIRGMVEDLRIEKKLEPFHWEIEFPEVFCRVNGGFDCFVGNPPFAGKNTTLASGGESYIEWLKVLHEASHGNADLVAHFFRRAFNMARDGGTFGLIATNTIAQGDTRATGLRWICQHGGEIFNATRRYKWPGLAAVVVSVVHVHKKPDVAIVPMLDGKQAGRISAFLFHRGGDDDPAPLKENEEKGFVGSYVLGMGFTFDDSNPEATPIAEMHRLIKKDPRNQERIFPYLGGEELNTDPGHKHHRYVINFGQMSEEEARQWPDLMAIVEQKVKPERLAQKREIRAKYWWRYGEVAPALYEAIRNKTRVLACSLVSKYLAFAWLPSNMVFSHKLGVFAFEHDSIFALVQSRIHEVFALFFSSTLEDRLNYSPTDCFETFPFPPDWQHNKTLEDIGQHYYEYRAALMIQNNEGLTKTYNRFHNPDERNPNIHTFRQLHAQMDRAVLDAYGWTDLQPSYDYRVQLDESIRLTWSEDTRDEILARLLERNRILAQQQNAPIPKAPPPQQAAKAAKSAKKGGKDQGNLF